MMLAGGLGTRLGQAAKDVPKAMVSVAGAPFIEHQLKLLRRGGFERVILCVSHHCEQIYEFVGDGHQYELHVEYELDGDIPLGTGGAVRNALHRVSDQFGIIYGDTYLR